MLRLDFWFAAPTTKVSATEFISLFDGGGEMRSKHLQFFGQDGERFSSMKNSLI